MKKINVVYSKKPLGENNTSLYYDRLGSLYDEFYEETDYLGIDINNSLRMDIQEIISILKEIEVNGLIDIGSGTGYWRKYLKKIEKLLAIDISKEMLIQSKNEVIACNLLEINQYFEINCDVIDLDLENVVDYETAFIGFVFSHYSDSDIITILNKINKNTNIKMAIIVDSVYGKYRINRLDIETYKNVDINRKKISVYKRYFTKEIWLKLLEKVGMNTKINKSYWGETFFIEIIYL